jgi:hypothetical protein
MTVIRVFVLIVIFYCNTFSLTINPPLEFNGSSLKSTIELIFLKQDSASWVVDSKKSLSDPKVYLKIGNPVDFDYLLAVVLVPNGFDFVKDNNNNFYRIIDAGEKVTNNEIRRRKPFVYPSIETEFQFSDTPLDTAMNAVFSRTKNLSFSIDIKSEEINSIRINSKISGKKSLDAVLSIILASSKYVFSPDIYDIFHIRERKESDSYWQKIENLRKLKSESGKKTTSINGPLRLAGYTLESALEKIFSRSAKNYKYAVKNIESYGGVNYTTETTVALDEILKKTLEFTDLDYGVEKYGMYYVKKKDCIISNYDLGDADYSDIKEIADKLRDSLSAEGRIDIYNDVMSIVIVEKSDKTANILKTLDKLFDK